MKIRQAKRRDSPYKFTLMLQHDRQKARLYHSLRWINGANLLRLLDNEFDGCGGNSNPAWRTN